ncbi:MAG: thiamine-phosphate kinase [Dehalococcoidales bacterium]|nr:thiamine-phosphate kinase [Dehalococcoidales bacterium]
MKVSELGEAGLINLIAGIVNSTQDKTVPSWQQLFLGIGDDAAAWYGDSSIQLATVDALRQGVHFTLETMDWPDLGWKALAVNLSDIAAMGGLPRYALVSLTLPEETELENVLELYRGIVELARRFGVAIIGGDTDRSPLIDISITVIGSTRGREQPVLTRSAAKVGDKVAVTGYMGGAAGGLEMLTKYLQFDSKSTDSLIQAFRRPYPRIEVGQILVDKGVRAAIDISDGLIADLNHICHKSCVGARIEVDRVPVMQAVKANFGARALELALSGGEDYELLFTASSEIIEQVKAATSCPITVIGEIIADGKNEVSLVDNHGQPVRLAKTGWEHFKTD